MIQIDMKMPEKCADCIFCDDNCSCVASEYDGLGINVGCAYSTDRRDIRCPLKEVVRCRDCMFYNSMIGYCREGEKVCSPDEYCVDGRKKK